MNLKNVLKAVVLLGIAAQSVIAQKAENGKVIITGSRFTYPLVEKWIAEFSKVYPEVKFRIIARGGVNVDSANLIINGHVLAPEEIRPGYTWVNISRYALLPVANSKNPVLAEYGKKGIKEKQLKKLFFKKYDPFASEEDEKEKEDKNAYKPTIYTRAQKACAPTTFAKNYGFQQEDILGKPIGGDDKHLISAIERDTSGLTYNNLGFIYDITTRAVKPKLTVVPIDINGNGKLDIDENFYDNLDEVISRLERDRISEIPLEYVNIAYPKQVDETNRNLSLFLNWILDEGQKYNHEYGFVGFEKDGLAKQKEQLTTSFKQ